MPKIHIALVGGQATPVYQGIVYTNPDQVILICSGQTEKDAAAIREQLPSLQSSIDIKVISDTDLPSMEASARQLVNVIPADAEVSLNLSSGLKAWTLVFNNVFRGNRPDAKIFCLSQDGTVFDITEGCSDERVNFDMDAQFRLLGNEIANYDSFADYTAEDLLMMDTVKKWGFNYNLHRDLFILTKELFEKAEGSSEREVDVEVKGSRLAWNPDENRFTGHLKDKRIDFCTPHCWHILLNTGWFEVYVASLLAQFYRPENIRMNCIFKSKSDAVKNEVDIIVNAGSKLIFVECKTQVHNTTDVDKFNSVVRTYGGLGSKALFITNWLMKEESLEKCIEKGITTFYTNHKDVSTPEERKALMQQMLDKLVRSWNTK